MSKHWGSVAPIGLAGLVFGLFYFFTARAEAGQAFYLLLLPFVVGAVVLIALYCFTCRAQSAVADIPPKTGCMALAGILVLAFSARTVLCFFTGGMESDVGCFAAWAQMANDSFSTFYTSGVFADYPPGYIYILSVMGGIVKALGLSALSPLAVYIVTLPTIVCDILLALTAFLVVRKRSNILALAACSLVAFSPVLAYNSAVWKQVDSVLILALVGTFLLLQKNRLLPAAVTFAVAVLLKPQAFIMGPVFALFYIAPMFGENKKPPLRVLGHGALCAVLCCVLIFVGSVPFRGTQSAFWLVERYLDTASSYPSASVNAGNLFSMLGLNWKPLESRWLLTAHQWGVLFILLATAALMALFVVALKNKKLNPFVLGAFYLSAVFTFAHSMHERYILPGIVLLLFAFATTGESRLLRAGLLQSFVALLNISLAYAYFTDTEALGALTGGSTIRLLGLFQLLVFGYTAFACVSFSGAFPQGSRARTGALALGASLIAPDSTGDEPPFTRQDVLFLLIPTLAVAVISFTSLGSTVVPESQMPFSDGESVSITLPEDSLLYEVWIYPGIGQGSLSIGDGEGNTFTDVNVEFGEMYNWKKLDIPNSVQELTISGNGIVLNELVPVDHEGNNIKILKYSPNGAALVDEQNTRPARPSYMTGMYFDEIYHARTAFETLHGLPIYETTHPPLGKELIMLGVWLFGMNPFGWRFTGTLIGVLMVPLIYLLARLLLRDRSLALTCEILFAADCMRLTQSRIATIDVYAVFFIMLSYYFMLKYLRRSFSSSSTRELLLPLLFCGIAFGLGCASKWTGIYSGAGLAILFFYSLWREFSGNPEQRARFFARCRVLIPACVLFFVVIPLIIYIDSYLIIYLNAGKMPTVSELWASQTSMFSYHSKLTEGHPFASRWWSWPLVARPVWYYLGTGLPDGTIDSIALLGNPAVWWSAGAAFVGMCVMKLRRSPSKNALFLIVAVAAQYVPWWFISRATFLYHYFAVVPFIILAFGWFMQRAETPLPRAKYVRFAVVAVSVVLFFAFLPVSTGIPVPNGYITALEWFPSWGFGG